MYFTPLVLAVATTSATTGLPFIKPPSLDIGVPIQAFGVIVAVGVLIGAAILRRYAEWHGVSDDHIRGITGWITVTGFIGAHFFDVLMYEPHKLDEEVALWPPSQWPVLLRLWDGISSYGGFVGGALGFAFYVWWKRLPARLFADIAIIGLLPAFSIGRIGCTVVSDHVGALVDPSKWYAALAMDYPTSFNNTALQKLIASLPTPRPEMVKAWNLGLVEFLYLVPVNALVLWLAFRPSKRMPAGFITVLTGVLYAPVRFFLDYLRPEVTDKLHAGLTFAQWCSVLAFGVSVYVAAKILKSGKPAETVTRTSKEAQERLKVLLKDEDDERSAGVDKAKSKATVKDMSNEKPRTENVVADAKISPSNEVPADEGAEIDPAEAIKAREADSSIPDKSKKK